MSAIKSSRSTVNLVPSFSKCLLFKQFCKSPKGSENQSSTIFLF